MADIVTLDGRRITSKGITSGSNFRVPPLAEAPCCFGSAGQATVAQPQDLQQQVLCFFHVCKQTLRLKRTTICHSSHILSLVHMLGSCMSGHAVGFCICCIESADMSSMS